MTQITSHVLDTAIGKPASGVLITLQQQVGDGWVLLGSAPTDADGRVGDFAGSKDVLPAGVYKLGFYLSAYFEQQGVSGFYPQVDVIVELAGNGEHYHIPLLISPFGYSTYRGS